MKWTYSIRNKMLASATLFTLCLLVLLSNSMDRYHTDDVKNAIKTLYEDRVIAEHYILKMTHIVYQIKGEIVASQPEGIFKQTKTDSLITVMTETGNAFLQTKFTQSENIKFAELAHLLKDFETSRNSSVAVKLDQVEHALSLLNDLSLIQLDESKHIMEESEKLYISGKSASKFAFVVIIIIMGVLQVLVFAAKPIDSKVQQSQLN